MFKNAWLIGAGAGSFSQYLVDTKDFYANSGYSHAHNEYLSILSQYGLIGFLLFVLLVKPIGFILSGSLCGLGISKSFDTKISIILTTFFFIFLFFSFLSKDF